jgi:hypothetical protein
VKIELLVTSLVALYVAVNLLNIVPLNPVSYELSFVYPIYPKPLLVGNTSLVVNLMVSAHETIAENVPVTISHVIGTMSPSLAQVIGSVAVCFRDAVYTSNPQETFIGNSCPGSILLQTDLPVSGLGISLGGPNLVGQDVTIQWPKKGDYYGTLVIYFSNGTILPQDYQQNRVPVEPAYVLQEQIGNRNLQTVEIASFVLGLTWVIPLLGTYFGNRRDGDSVGRLDTDSNHEAQVTEQKDEKTVGDENTKKRVQQEHRKKSRKDHQPSSNAKE